MSTRITATILFFLMACVCRSQNYRIRSFSAAQNLPDPYVYAVIQDKDGFLWVSTGKGLAKFDGQFFDKVNTGLPPEEIIYSSALQKDGTLWFGTFSGKLLAFDGKNFIPLSKTCKASITKILAGENGDLILNTIGNGIFIRHKEDLVQLQGSDAYQINDIVLFNPEALIAGTSEGLFYVDLKTNAFTKLSAPEGDIKRIQVLKQKPHTFIVSTAKGELYETEIMSASEARSNLLISTKQSAAELKNFFYSEDKHIVYAAGAGETLVVSYKDQERSERVPESEFLAGINCIYQDAENNVWMGSAGKGLYRLSLTAYTTLDIGEQVYAIASDARGNMYYGTASGISVYDKDQKWIKRIGKSGNKTLGKITALYIHNNELWIGSEEKGLTVLTIGDQRNITPEFSDIPNITVNAITGKDNRVSVSTNLEGVFNYTDGKLQDHFSVKNSLLHNNVYYSLVAKNNKTYYATHNTSFNHSLGSQLYEIDMKPLGLISEFNCFAEDSKGVIAVATNGDGVYMIRDTTIRPLMPDEEIGSKFCESVLYDNKDNLWIATRYELYKYYPGRQVLSEVNFSAAGATMLNPKAFYHDATGNIYFGTNKGVLHFAPADSVEKVPVPYLVSLRIQDSIIDKSTESDLSSGSYRLVFDFSALGLTHSEYIKFMYKLEGRDEHWSEPGTSRKAEFSRLSEGTYTFKVIAMNSEGFSSPETVLYHFKIAPPFWKRPLFWVTVLILLMVSVMMFVRIRTRALIRTKELLEMQVAEKTKELRAEKELVEKKNKRIEEQNHEIKDSITYAKRIQDALLPDKDLVSASGKHLFVFYQPRDIVSGDFYWIAEIGNLKLIAMADCTGHGVPGALMSMIGTTLLNKIILERKITQPKLILEELDKEVRHALKQYKEEATRDGMDISLCVLDKQAKKLTYAGAMRPMMLVSERQLTEYVPTKHAIGGYSYGNEKTFEETEIMLKGKEMFYLFSDGYADQFGGEKGKKLMLKNFKKILISISEMELEKQEENLRRVYNNWKGGLDQVDDVLVIGVRV